MSKFIMIKALSSLPSLDYLEESYKNNGVERKFYITGSESDKTIARGLVDDYYPIYFLVFTQTDKKKKVEYIYLGSGIKYKSGNKLAIKCSILQKIAHK